MKTTINSPTTSMSPTPIGSSSSVRHGIFVMLLSVAAFTVNALLLRYLSGKEVGIAPEVPLAFRSAVGVLIVFLFFQGKRPTEIRPIFTKKKLILRGLTGLFGTAAYYWTVPELGAGMATLICNTYVIFASVIAVIALGEKLSAKRVVWLIASFAGIILLIGPGSNMESFRFGWYEFVAIFGAVMAASSVVLVRQLVADYSIGTIYLSQCVWIFLPVAIMAAPQLGGLGILAWALLILSGALAGFGQLLMNEGYRCLPVSTGASIQMLWPVGTVTGGWLIFHETFTVVQMVGASIVLMAIWRMSVRKS